MKTNRTLIGITFILIVGIIYSCEKEDSEENIQEGKQIEIKTKKDVYDNSEMIHLRISNKLEDTAYHFKCDNYNLEPTYILKKQSDIWVKKELHYICTQMGPMGYFGKLIPSQTKNDSLEIDSTGTYKLRYTFIINSDTSYYTSNMFEVLNKRE